MSPSRLAQKYVYDLQIPTIPASRNSNHWVGTNKIGTDDGRGGGTAVVDLDTKVYGTDNLFVVDASIFPGMTTGNPSAAIIIASEKATERILALKAPTKLRIMRDA
jgi:cellobiose dehydrogenase (acceptor)